MKMDMFLARLRIGLSLYVSMGVLHAILFNFAFYVREPAWCDSGSVLWLIFCKHGAVGGVLAMLVAWPYYW